jgi:glutathione S-transferase
MDAGPRAREGAMMRLYHSPLSPFCRKVRLTLAEKRLEVELVEERYWERDPDFLRRSPAGKVPVLKVEAAFLTESAAICEWLDEMHPAPPLMPQDPWARYEVRRLVQFFDDTFHRDVTERLLGERVGKKISGRGHPDSAAVKAGTRAVKRHLDRMEALLEERRWLAGDALTLADFAAAAHVSALDYISDIDWDRVVHVRDWYAKIKSRPAFRGLLSDAVPGFPPPPHYADLDF